MVLVKKLKGWLSALDDTDFVGIDDGGLMLQVFGGEEYYFEIGGLPEEADECECDRLNSTL